MGQINKMDLRGEIQFTASLLRQEGSSNKKQDRQTDKQSIKFKAGEIKCCKEIKITAPLNDWCKIPLNKKV